MIRVSIGLLLSAAAVVVASAQTPKNDPQETTALRTAESRMQAAKKLNPDAWEWTQPEKNELHHKQSGLRCAKSHEGYALDGVAISGHLVKCSWRHIKNAERAFLLIVTPTKKGESVLATAQGGAAALERRGTKIVSEPKEAAFNGCNAAHFETAMTKDDRLILSDMLLVERDGHVWSLSAAAVFKVDATAQSTALVKDEAHRYLDRMLTCETLG